MNEAETRAEHVDPTLKAAGWGVVGGSRIRREYPITPGRITPDERRSRHESPVRFSPQTIENNPQDSPADLQRISRTTASNR
ncbi:MAG: hypothetical protein ABSA42_08980 [Terracidiphilus sp.]|jgi:hypothetical protein